MYLRALELQGFKSFPDKTILTFGSDITGIVGPNGSGKSNISDAIRWVMGEMSTKALRGGKMEDVIFGGTLKRPQVGFAEVTLVIDNTAGIFPIDSAEVMVTRRYFRSGDSEYYINKESARLKDVVELFMDTGLGREGYSQVGQGRIDEIISAKSTDRREIFEEAAGISKFRHRKEESERKLKSTDENLTRINDKIAELELSVEPLREQAEKAKRYLILRDELRGLEVTVWLDNLEKHRESAKKAMEDYAAAKAQSQQVQDELNGLYEAVENVTAEMRESDSEAEEIRSLISRTEAEIAELEGSIGVSRTQLINTEENLANLEKSLEEQDDRSGSIKAQIESRENRIACIRQREDEKQREKAGLDQSHNKIKASSEALIANIRGIEAQKDDRLRRAQKLDGELANMAGGVQQLYDRENAIAIELTELKKRKAQTLQEQESCSGLISRCQEEAQSLENTIRGYELRKKSRDDKYRELEQKLLKLTVDRNSIKARMDMLAEMERDYEGYSKAVKIVMAESEKGRLSNILGPVSKLVKTEDSLTVAIETALGGSMQSIIVKSEEDGKAAIELLKRRDGGRATFLPITSVKGTKLNEAGLEDQRGFVGIASDLVSFPAELKGIFTSLLGRIVIADNMDCAIAIARRYSHKFRIVTTDGQVLNAGGSMTGGSTAKSSGILSRANELKRLGEQYKKTEEDYASVQHQTDEAKRLVTQVEYELSVARDELRAKQDDILKLQGQYGQYELLTDSIDSAAEGLRSEQKNIKDKLDNNTQAIDGLRSEAQSLKAEADTLESSRAELLSRSDEIERQIQELAAALTANSTELAALDAEKTALQRGIQELSELEASVSGDRQQSIEKIAALKQQGSELKAKIESLTTGLTESKNALEGHKATLKKEIDHKLELEGQRTRLDRQAQEKNRELLVVERETARLEQKKAAAEMEEKQLADKLWDSYELTITTASEIRREDISTSKATKRIAEIKKDISALGTPNIGAIEEFQRVNSRYEFLTGQRNDVQTSIDELEGVIRDITSEMKIIFADKFRQINESFKETFADIFGGGSGELILEDEEDILSCGIEIKVQPPGKSVKTITLLSGGEKTFVAIALYFAILKVSPTPFCVLDEIDAALDDNNVLKYAKYMRKLADKTQFIVITHRRGTMEQADVLYGVTMQEQGVSKILTLDLSKMADDMKL